MIGHINEFPIVVPAYQSRMVTAGKIAHMSSMHPELFRKHFFLWFYWFIMAIRCENVNNDVLTKTGWWSIDGSGNHSVITCSRFWIVSIVARFQTH